MFDGPLQDKLNTRFLETLQRLESLATRRSRPHAPTRYEEQILADLESEGVHVTHVDRLLQESAPAVREALAGALDLVRQGPSLDPPVRWNRATSSTDLAAEHLIAYAPQLYLLGLNARVLRLAELYLKLPVAYHGAVLRHSLVDGISTGPRQWHQDAEDFHVLRMLVYLNDVAPGGGPFEYIPRSTGLSYRSFRGVESMLTNERMRAVMPEAEWRQCTGPAGTVIFCDTAAVFHHESLQTERDRSVVMLGFSSRRPKNPKLAMAHFPVERVREQLYQIVPSENYAHVFGWRAPRRSARFGSGIPADSGAAQY